MQYIRFVPYFGVHIISSSSYNFSAFKIYKIILFSLHFFTGQFVLVKE